MFKSFSWLFFAHAFAQFIQLAMQPILTKYFSPADFNSLGQVLSLATILVIGGNLQLHTCLSVARSDETREELLRIGLGWLTSFSLVVILSALTISIISSADDVNVAWGISLGLMVWLIGTANLMFGYYTGIGDFKQSGYLSIGRAISISLAQLSMTLKPVGNGLLLGLLLGEFFVRGVYKSFFRRLRFFSWCSNFMPVLRGQKNYVFFGTIQEAVSVLVLMTPLYFFGHRFGDEIGGNYVFAYRIMWAPVILIAGSISPILLRHLSVMNTSVLLRAGWRLVAQSILIFCVSVIFLNFIFIPILDWWLDERWDYSVVMMGYISLWVSAYLSVLKIRQLYRVLLLQKIQLAIDLLIASMLILIFMYAPMSWNELIVISSLIGVAQNLLILIVFVFISRFSAKFRIEA